MKEEKFDKIEMLNDNVKVVLEFPKKMEDEEEVVSEIRSILSGELRDILERASS